MAVNYRNILLEAKPGFTINVAFTLLITYNLKSSYIGIKKLLY